MSELFAALKQRGLIYDSTRDTETYLKSEKHPVGYVGFDPTARSLHIGSLIPIMGLVHLQQNQALDLEALMQDNLNMV